MSHNTVNPNILLYIHVDESKKSPQRIEDELVEHMRNLFRKSTHGVFPYTSETSEISSFDQGRRYKGFHRVDSLICSTNHDYLLPCGKYVTNSACIYYLQHYRDQIPPSEIIKLAKMLDNNGISWDSRWFDYKGISGKGLINHHVMLELINDNLKSLDNEEN